MEVFLTRLVEEIHTCSFEHSKRLVF
jgi:hypothetical protein